MSKQSTHEVRIAWSPLAAQTLLGLVAADQRRLVDAVSDFKWRFVDQQGGLSAAAQHRITAGKYDISFRVQDDLVEVQGVASSGEVQ